MKNSLLITKYIRSILEQDKALMKLIPIKNFYPVDAKHGTKYPFAVIIRIGLEDDLSKDGVYEDTVVVQIYVVDDNYYNSITIANEIRNWLEGHTFKDDTIYIRKMKLSASSEAYYNDAYIQELTFNIKLS